MSEIARFNAPRETFWRHSLSRRKALAALGLGGVIIGGIGLASQGGENQEKPAAVVPSSKPSEMTPAPAAEIPVSTEGTRSAVTDLFDVRIVNAAHHLGEYSVKPEILNHATTEYEISVLDHPQFEQIGPIFFERLNRLLNAGTRREEIEKYESVKPIDPNLHSGAAHVVEAVEAVAFRRALTAGAMIPGSEEITNRNLDMFTNWAIENAVISSNTNKATGQDFTAKEQPLRIRYAGAPEGKNPPTWSLIADTQASSDRQIARLAQQENAIPIDDTMRQWAINFIQETGTRGNKVWKVSYMATR